MSTELERRLRAAFDGGPGPSAEATGRARRAALGALPQSTRPQRGRLLIALAAVVVASALAAAALAATGTLPVHVGARPRRSSAPAPRLAVPPGTHGIALVAGGRLWLVTRAGLRIEGMPVSTAELSPRALYAVVGVGSSLVALAPGRRRAWTHATAGRVVAAAWSPDGLKIAYVVAVPAGAELRLIEGDGDHDRLLDGHAAAVKPVWRQDSLAVAYVRADGRGALFDLGRGRRVPRAGRVRVRAEGWDSATALSPRRDAIAVASGLPDGALELRIVPRGRARPARLLLRVRHVLPSPVAISWR